MAEQFSIKAEKREALGTRVSRRLRKSGKLPAANVTWPRMWSSKLRSTSGTRSRSDGCRPSARNAARCSSVSSRSWLS